MFNLFLILIILALSIIVVDYSGLLTIDLSIISFYDAFDLSQNTIVSLVLFKLVTKLVSLVTKSCDLYELLINLLW